MDSYVRYRLSDGIILRAGVDNIFNITPDFVGNGQQQANTFPNIYDTLGAYFHFGINVFLLNFQCLRRDINKYYSV